LWTDLDEFREGFDMTQEGCDIWGWIFVAVLMIWWIFDHCSEFFTIGRYQLYYKVIFIHQVAAPFFAEI